ncbi:MAG: hypothetical protein ACD_2C00201G0008 [uncultured bacterium (gcode 4)]|uniref:Uncharacterized protein n=1 Tax=uncultured bacterium (gcode 4) TaxID=1234023 RepID=K2FDQ9_9BACT|nr:MAG: hypothetical protein ACD_2C00201G0008 [uncultured bacterium (gcode 4)]
MQISNAKKHHRNVVFFYRPLSARGPIIVKIKRALI